MAFARAPLIAADGTFSATGATAWNTQIFGVAGADVGGIPYCPTATSETTVPGFTFGTAAGQGLTVSPAASATTDVQALSVAQTWNNAGINFTGAKLNVTATAKGATSKLLDLQYAGTSYVNVGTIGVNSSIGDPSNWGLQIINGVDKLTFSANNQYISQITALNNLAILTDSGSGHAGSSGVSIGGPTLGTTPIVGDPNGINLSRRGIIVGRHGGQLTTGPVTLGPVHFKFEPHAQDETPSQLHVIGQSVWAQGTVNTTGGDILVAGGIGRRFITVSNFASLGGKTVTVVINGTSTTKTEGVNWTAATSNAATATSLAAAFSAVTGIDSSQTVAVGAVAYFAPSANGMVYSFSLTSNDAANLAVTSGADGNTTIYAKTTARIVKRVSTQVSSATPTISTDDVDVHTITALATAITSMTTNLSGTPTAEQSLLIRIKDDGTARAIAWGASFTVGDIPLPTTTVISKYLYCAFIYNTTLAQWVLTGKLDNVA